MFDTTTLFVGAAISAFSLSGLIVLACVHLRQFGYLLTVGGGLFSVGLTLAALVYYRMGGEAWAGIATLVLMMGSFLLIHCSMSQYIGNQELGLFEFSALPLGSLCCILFWLGFDGAAFFACYAGMTILVFESSTRYWSHRREVPLLMECLTLIGMFITATFALRAYALASGETWVLNGAPSNWAEDLTAAAAVSLFTAFGPLVVALYHYQDRVALISEAATDPLTRLSNRRALMERFGDATFTSGMAVMMFDLDHFKKTNDVFGHQIGDEVLKRFAYVVNRHISKDDKGFRLGGEEFTVVSARGGEKRALDLARRISVAFGAEVVGTPLGPLRSTASCGVATGSASASRLYDVISQADAALYEAKRSGRNRVTSHNEISVAVAEEDRRVA